MKWMKETKESDEMSLRCKGKKKGRCLEMMNYNTHTDSLAK